MLLKLGFWMSGLGENQNTAGGSFLLLADGSSFLLLSDTSSKLMRAS